MVVLPITENEFIRLMELCGQQEFVSDTIYPVVDTSGSQIEKSAEPSCGKYAPLLQFLQRQTADQIIITYAEAEAILGFRLPNSAYTYTMWWNPKGHSHCQAWLQAGFSVTDVSKTIRTKIITFNRIK